MCVPVFCKKFSVGRELFLSPTLNIIQPIKLDMILNKNNFSGLFLFFCLYICE